MAAEVLVNLLCQREGFGSCAGDASNQRLYVCRQKCSRHSLAGHVCEGDQSVCSRKSNHIEVVAAHIAKRLTVRLDFVVRRRLQFLWNQRLLNFPRSCLVGFELGFSDQLGSQQPVH